ncbi:SAM-dependent DNA methyltransferase [Ferrovibrio sp.]|uniref:SAM-dependent DNA methyltransferase n=1 Tax=Ferrovibrio sp. TaxID=1917215 RepID=UPI0035B4CE30
MSQNISTAVMQRRLEPHDSLDDFPTPPWATRALMQHVLIGGGFRADTLADMSSREPCCNRGYMARPMAEYFKAVEATDIFPYGYGDLADYLSMARQSGTDFTIFNPPFKLAEQFILRGLETSRIGVAAFVRGSFYEGIQRYRRLFNKHRPTFYAPFSERVILVKGRLLDPDRKYPKVDRKTGETKMVRPSSATAYAWFVWLKDSHVIGRTEVKLIPPCRKQLTQPGDYPEAA